MVGYLDSWLACFKSLSSSIDPPSTLYGYVLATIPSGLVSDLHSGQREELTSALVQEGHAVRG